MAPNTNSNNNDMTTTASKDFGNPVQVNTNKLFMDHLSKSDKEQKMREKTAHIGYEASLASQGANTTKKDDSRDPPQSTSKSVPSTNHANADNTNDMTTTASKDFGNPVQVNTNKLFIDHLSHSQEEQDMREKTAHIGYQASLASQSN